MEVSGKIIAVLPIQSGEGRNGTWKKQDYVIEYDINSQYPHKMMFNLWSDKIDLYNIELNKNYRIGFDIDSHEYQRRWFNDIKVFKVEKEEDSGAPPDVPPPGVPPTYPLPTDIDEGGDLTSDLPF